MLSARLWCPESSPRDPTHAPGAALLAKMIAAKHGPTLLLVEVLLSLHGRPCDRCPSTPAGYEEEDEEEELEPDAAEAPVPEEDEVAADAAAAAAAAALQSR
eukprot:RCo012664